MTDQTHLYFLVEGGVVLANHQKALADHQAAHDRCMAVATKYGATATYGNSSGCTGLEFPGTHPDAWRKSKSDQHVYLPPVGKAGREIRAELNALKMYTGRDYHAALSGDWFGYICRRDPNHAGTGFPIRFIHYEEIGDQLVLLVPNCDGGMKWKPGDDQCHPIKASEYWALKEAVAAKEVPIE